MSSEAKPITPWSAEYFAIIAEIDASFFVLEQMQQRFSKRAPIVQMIDENTGYDKQQLEEAKAIVDRIKVLQAKLPADDPHFISLDEGSDLVTNNLEAKHGSQESAPKGKDK